MRNIARLRFVLAEVPRSPRAWHFSSSSIGGECATRFGDRAFSANICSCPLKQANKEARKHGSEEAREQGSKQASEQGSKLASKQGRKEGRKEASKQVRKEVGRCCVGYGSQQFSQGSGVNGAWCSECHSTLYQTPFGPSIAVSIAECHHRYRYRARPVRSSFA